MLVMKKMYTLEEAFALVGKRVKAIKTEVTKTAGAYLNADDIEEIHFALDLAVDPARAAKYLQVFDTIVREAAVDAIVKVTGGAVND